MRNTCGHRQRQRQQQRQQQRRRHKRISLQPICRFQEQVKASTVVSARAGAESAQGKGLHSHKPSHVLHQGQGHSMTGIVTREGGERGQQEGMRDEPVSAKGNFISSGRFIIAFVHAHARIHMRVHARMYVCVSLFMCVCVCTDLCEVTRVKCVSCGFSTRAGRAKLPIEMRNR